MSRSTKMIKVWATMSHTLHCHVVVRKWWSSDPCWEYARDHLDGESFLEYSDSGEWHTFDHAELTDSEATAVMKVVANDGDAVIVDADPTVFDEDLMNDAFEDDDKVVLGSQSPECYNEEDEQGDHVQCCTWLSITRVL